MKRAGVIISDISAKAVIRPSPCEHVSDQDMFDGGVRVPVRSIDRPGQARMGIA